MDIALPKQRFDALNILCEGFRPSVPVSHIARIFGFVARASEPSVQEQRREVPAGSSQSRFVGRHPPAVSNQTSCVVFTGLHLVCFTVTCTL